MNKAIFITGTDTDIGKTFVCMGLCVTLMEKGLKVGYYKPFQSGAYEKNGVLVAPDVEEFKKYPKIKTKYSYLFKGDISPHLASLLDNIEVDINKIKNDLKELLTSSDFVVIEGAGGLYCPAYKRNLYSDIIKELNQEIIIVTTPDLGRINHTLMTIDCAKNCGINIKGLVVNKMPDKKTLSQENFINELKCYTDCKILCVIPEMKNASKNDILKAFKDICI